MDITQIQINVLSDSTCSIKKYSGSEETVEIPSAIEKDGKNYQVIEIGVCAFKQNRKLKNVLLPEGVTVIRDEAFNGCDQLETVALPSSVSEIKDNAFKGCFKLDGVVLPASLTVVGEHCFEYCKKLSAIALPASLKVVASKAFTNCESLEQLTIAEGVEEIQDSAFNECALTELTIPCSVTKIGKKAFCRCSKLKKVLLNEELKSGLDSSVFSGCPSVELVTGADPISWDTGQPDAGQTEETAPAAAVSSQGNYHVEVLSDTTCVIVEYKGDETVVKIPSEVEKGNKSYKVVEIGQLAFAKKKIPGRIAWKEERVNHTDEITITILPEAVNPEYKGYQTIREIIVPEGVKTISKAAFYGCEGLEKISLPQSLEKLEEGAFSFCTRLKSVSLPNGVTIIPEHAFENCENLASFSGMGVTEIKRNAFTCCRNLKSLSLPQNVTIEGDAFLACDYMQKNKVAAADEAAMAMFQMKKVDGGCAITGFEGEGDVIVVPDEMQKNGESYKVVTIAGYAFAKKKKLQKVVLPETVESIADYAFSESSITEIEIPSSVREIKNYAFDGCAQLERLTLADGLSVLGKNVFSGCSSLKSVRIPDSIKSIPASTFFKCTALQQVELPENLESIESGAFANCTSLEHIELPKYVGKIASNAFADSKCEVDDREFMVLTDDTCALTRYQPKGTSVELQNEVYINGSLHKVLTIGDYAFSERKIESVKLPDYLENIGRSAFSNCKNLSKITIPSTLKTVGELAFASCEALKEISLPESVTVIMDKAFSGCSNLEVAAVPGVTEFKKRAFANCSRLKTLSGLQSNVTMGEEAFINCKELDFSSSAGSNSGQGAGASVVMLEMKPIDGSTCAISGFKGEGDVDVPAEMQKDGKAYRVVKIKEYAFAKSKKLGKVVLPDTVEFIGDYAFSESSLTEIVIPSSVKEIRNAAFDDCKQLVKVTLSEGLEKLGAGAFSGCENLPSVAIPEGITTIAKGTFSGCGKLVEVQLPSSVVKIEDTAFRRCESLKEINLADCIYQIAESAFDDTPIDKTCRRFEVLGGDSCAVVRYGAVGVAVVPAEVVMDGKAYRVVSIKDRALAYMVFEKVVLPDTLEVIEKYAFSDCQELKEVVWPNGLREIGEAAFSNCCLLERVDLPESVEKVGDRAFAFCTNLAEVNISGSPEFGEDVFLDCPKLDGSEEEETEADEQSGQESVETANVESQNHTALVATEENGVMAEDDDDETREKVIEIRLDELGITEDNCTEKAEELINDHSQMSEMEQLVKIAEFQQTANCLIAAHNNGNYEATYYLSLFYENGYGVERDEKRAVSLVREAAENDYAPAQNRLAAFYASGNGVDQSDELMFEWFKRAAENGDADGQYNVGICYFYGRGTEQNEAEAAEWFQNAAVNGSTPAQFRLGFCYMTGRGIDKDQKEAVTWYKKAAENGAAIAMYELGRCYEKGVGVVTDINKAAEYYHKAAENGHSKAQVKYGLVLFGFGGDDYLEAAFGWFKRAAEECLDAEAQYYVGTCFLNGQGVDKDEEEAAEWFEKSAKQGYALAQLQLAWLYMNGEGVDEDKERAAELYAAAAEQGNAQAQFYIGWCYGNGEGVDQNYRKAVEWLEKSAENGFAEASKHLEYYKQFVGDDDAEDESEEDYSNVQCTVDEYYAKACQFFNSNRKKAKFFFTKAAEMGHATSQFYLATFCDGEQDFEKAMEWYTKSAEGGYVSAMFPLAMRYETGMCGVEVDYGKAIKWYRQCASMFPAAKVRLGVLLYKSQSYEEAAEVLNNASQADETGEAAYYLSECYKNGLGVAADGQKAQQYAAEAKKKGFEP